MELESAKAELRVRPPWESADLGVRLLRHLVQPVARTGLIYVLPLQLALLALLSPVSLTAGAALVWWLKPLYDRVYMLVLGRGLFGDAPRGRAFAQALWAHGRRGLLADLTYGRLSPARTVVLPIHLLEQLSGKPARKRQQGLLQRQSGVVSQVTVAAAIVEVGCAWGLWSGAVFVAQGESAWGAVFATDIVDLYELAIWSYLVALNLVEPLFVAAGFGLYLNRRTILEGWDIELTFRRMARRLSEAGRSAALVLLAASAALGHGQVQAQATYEEAYSEQAYSEQGDEENYAEDEYEEPGVEAFDETDEALRSPFGNLEQRIPLPDVRDDRTSQATMEGVLRRPELSRDQTSERWVLKESILKELLQGAEEEDTDEPPSWVSDMAQLIAGVLETLLWIAALLVVGAVLLVVIRKLDKQANTAKPLDDVKPLSSTTASVAPQPIAPPLPAGSVPSRFNELLERGAVAEALSLLYRSTLAQLDQQHTLEIPRDATEGECVRRVRSASLPQDHTTLFLDVTRSWQRVAYAHGRPDPESLRGLGQRFEHAFGGPR